MDSLYGDLGLGADTTGSNNDNGLPSLDNLNQQIEEKKRTTTTTQEAVSTKKAEEEEEPKASATIADNGEEVKKEEEEVGLVFVGGLAWETTEPGLRMYFEIFGEVKSIDFKRGYAFIHYKTNEGVMNCSKKGTEQWIDGKRVDVKVSYPSAKGSPNMTNVHNSKSLSNDPETFNTSTAAATEVSSSAGGGSQPSTSEQLSDQDSSRDAPGLNVGRKVFVGGLSQDIREQDLREFMQHYGNIEDVVVMMDRYTKRSRGFGFVTFVTRGEAEAASKVRRQILGGKNCEVKLYEPGAKGTFAAERTKYPYAATQQQHPGYYQNNYSNNDWNQHRGFRNQQHYQHSAPQNQYMEQHGQQVYPEHQQQQQHYQQQYQEYPPQQQQHQQPPPQQQPPPLQQQQQQQRQPWNSAGQTSSNQFSNDNSRNYSNNSTTHKSSRDSREYRDSRDSRNRRS